MLVILILLSLLLLSACMRPQDTRCNYDGVCDDWETDDCPDCADVLGRGVPVLPVDETEDVVSDS